MRIHSVPARALLACMLCCCATWRARAIPATTFTGDVVISEFAAATSDRLLYWPEDGPPRLGMGIPWTDLFFNDSAWKEAPGGFGTAGTGVGTVINISGKAYGIYTRKIFHVSTNDALSGDPLELIMDFEDGVVAYLNGREIARRGLGMPGSFVYHDTRANNTLQNCGSNHTFVAGIASNLLAPGANVLAIAVRTSALYTTPWRLVARLRLARDPALDLVLPGSAWKYFIGYTEPLGGLRTPAAPPPPLPEPWLARNENIWRYYVGTNEPSGAPTLAWAGLGFDDSSWRSGPGALGYNDPGIMTTVNIQNLAWSLYIRQTFEVLPEHLANGNQLLLSAIYDDGFVAYINGKEVARNNMGTNAFVAHNQAAPSGHEASQIERFFINNASNLVQAGTNVLAIQVHNTTLNSSDLSINANLDMVYDGIGTYEDQDVADEMDWIELHNRGAHTVSLAGWALTDNADKPEKWILPNIAIEPGGHFLIFASGMDLTPSNEPPHTNFKLGSKGEYLALLDNNSPRVVRCAFAPAFPTQSYFHSFGLAGSGNDYRYLERPTPGAANDTNAVYDMILPAPQISASRGYYSAPLSVTMSCAVADAVIRYSTNGTVPTLSTGMLYTQPLTFTRTVALRARALKAGCIPSDVITHTYLLDELPVKKTLPAICLAGDEERDLFEPHGLMAISGGYSNWWPATSVEHYNNGTPTGRAYERSVSAELIYPHDNRNVQINAGLRTAGQGGRGTRRRGPDWSQQTYKYDLRLYFRGSYGTERLEYLIYTNSPVATFNQICIKSGFWDDCINPGLKDELFRRLMGDCGQLVSHGIHVNLFINGTYKSYYNLIERPNEEFFQDHYRTTNAWEVFKLAVAEGDTKAWNALLNFIKSGTNSPLIDANYQWVAQRLDLVNFIDYLLVSVYAHNSDWPANNWVSAREHTDGAVFRFYPWDSGCSFGYSGSVTNNTFALIYRHLSSSAPVSLFYAYLRQHPEFRLLFADRIQKHFFHGGALTDMNVSNRYTELRTPMEPIVTFVQSNYNNAKFNNNVQNDWIPRRRAIIFEHFVNELLWPGVSAPLFSQRGGMVSNNFALVLSHTNAAGSVYYTTDGSDPRAFGGGIAGTLYTAPIIVTGSMVVAARVYDGAVWSPLADAAFSYAYAYQAVKISEIMYNPAAGGSEFIELFNTADEAVPLHDPLQPAMTWRIEDDTAVMCVIPPGMTIGPKQYMVLVGQDVSTAAFAAAHNVPGTALVFGPCTRNLGNGGDAVRVFRPQDSSYALVEEVYFDDEPPWPTLPDGNGPSLQRIDFSAPVTDATNWTSGPMHGTPGRAVPEPALAGAAALGALLLRRRPSV